MSYHIISIDAPNSHLTCSKGQLILQSEVGEKRISMEDVGAIIITSFKCTITNKFIIEACKQRIGLIFCEQYKPAAIVLPANRVTDTKVIRHLAHLPAQLKQRLWEKTLDAKCHNQLELARLWYPDHPLLKGMERLSQIEKKSREAECAKLFWQIFSESHASGYFKRGRFEDGYNPLFNYAYAILLSCMLQRLLALGLDPSFGIFHKERPQATPLAYDLMEPFRPIFDANVSRWILQRHEAGDTEHKIAEINNDYRRHIIATLHAEVEYEKKRRNLRATIDAVLSSFRLAISSLKTSPYKPWTTSIIKWVG